MKLNTNNNNVTEIMNYRNKLFEYKSDHYDSTYDSKYIVDYINPNESHLKFNSGYFERNIIEDYRITVFIVIKDNTDNIFRLYVNSDHSLTLLHVESSTLLNTDNLVLTFTTSNILLVESLVTTFSNKKNIICLSWNGVNSAAYINGKKYILLIILELVLQQVEFINLIHLMKVNYMNL